MRPRVIIIIVSVSIMMVLGLLAWLLLSQPPPTRPRHQFTVTIAGITNGPSGIQHATLCISNSGRYAAAMLPTYFLETRPTNAGTAMAGTFPWGLKALEPSQTCTTTIAIPPFKGRDWRLSLTCYEVRPPWRDFGHYWLMQARLARRYDPGFISCSEWVSH
jgi:hypothetical protein